MSFVSIKGGEFTMGSSDNEKTKRPLHRVKINPFIMSVTVVTQAQYERITGQNPSRFAPDSNFISIEEQSRFENRPVESVTWYHAARFCNVLSKRVGLDPCYDSNDWSCDFALNGFRLPTEAEWEYACRAGTTTRFHTGNSRDDLSRAGWFDANSDHRTHSVRQKESNAFGLYDMHGNVWEWCNDWYTENYNAADNDNPRGPVKGQAKVIRGGSWHFFSTCCESAYCGYHGPDRKYYDIGFRVVRRK